MYVRVSQKTLILNFTELFEWLVLLGKIREVVKNKAFLFTLRLTVRVDPPAPPLTVSKKKSRPLIMNVYGLKQILTKGNFFDHFSC